MSDVRDDRFAPVSSYQATDSRVWHHVLCNAFSQTDFLPDSDSSVRGELLQARLDSARMSTLASSAGQFRRQSGLIRRDSFDGFLILMCLKGELRLEQNDRSLRARAGEAIIYRQGSPFRLTAPVAYEAAALWVTPEKMATHCPMLAVAAPVVLGRDNANGRLALFMVQELCEAAVVGEARDPLMLIGAALDVVSTNIQKNDSDVTLRTHLLIEKLREHLHDNIDDADMSLDRLVNVSGVSARTLNRVFGEAGTTPMQWVRDVRLTRAHAALQAGKFRNVTEAAYALGFKDSAHFSRSFSRKFGLSPIQALRRK